MADKETDKQRGGSGNFASDPKKASEAGKKGGEHSHAGQQSQSGSGGKAQHGGKSDDDDAKGKNRSNASDKTS
jgi:general stress protein YciG